MSNTYFSYKFISFFHITFLLQKCISLEEAQVKRHMSNIQSWKSPILPKHHKTARRSNISAVETLLRWTRSTKYFDSIVVLFEVRMSLNV